MNKIVRDKGRAVCSALNISFKQMHYFHPGSDSLKGGEKRVKKIKKKKHQNKNPTNQQNPGEKQPPAPCVKAMGTEGEGLLLSVFPWAVQGAPVGHSLESSRWSRAGAAPASFPLQPAGCEPEGQPCAGGTYLSVQGQTQSFLKTCSFAI